MRRRVLLGTCDKRCTFQDVSKTVEQKLASLIQTWLGKDHELSAFDSEKSPLEMFSIFKSFQIHSVESDPVLLSRAVAEKTDLQTPKDEIEDLEAINLRKTTATKKAQ